METQIMLCAGCLLNFLLFADDKKVLWHWLEALISKLAELRLTIHPGAQPRPVTEGIPFLGFVLFPTHRRLKRRKGIHFQRKLKKLMQEYHDGDVPIEQVQASVLGWINHVRYGDTWGLREAILQDVIL